MLDDRKPEPRALRLLRTTAINAVKTFKDATLIGFRNSDSVILYGEGKTRNVPSVRQCFYVSVKG